jgi:toxin-antitoxin system PIN domain toxin
MTYLPDVNLWLALAVAEHVHHRAAREWVDTAANDTIAFCRVTQMGFLRLLTNPRVMADDALRAGAAWHLLESLRKDERIVFSPEPRDIERTWRSLTASPSTGPNFWTDTYLAAFAQSTGYTLVTFDRGFRKYKRLALRLLGAA